MFFIFAPLHSVFYLLLKTSAKLIPQKTYAFSFKVLIFLIKALTCYQQKSQKRSHTLFNLPLLEYSIILIDSSKYDTAEADAKKYDVSRYLK